MSGADGSPGRALPSVSVIIPTYQRRPLLPDVLAPVLANPAASEVIVVVDGSRDGSIEFLDQLARDHPRLRPCWTANGGANAARQRGVNLASGEIVLLLDDDVVALPGLIEGHARHHARTGDLVVVGYMPVRPAARGQLGHAPLILYDRAYEAACRQYERDPGQILLQLWGGNISLRRHDCEAIGISHPGGITGYHADRDFGLRCHEAGLRGEFDRSLRAEHNYSRTMEQFARDARRQGEELVRLHELHPAVLGPVREEDAHHRRIAKAVASVARVRPLRRPVRRSLLFLAQLAVAAGLSSLELACARLIARLERQLGMFDATRRAAPGI